MHPSVDGIELIVEGLGDQTIVMVHGWPDTWRLWDPTVDALKADHRCVRFTLPGFDQGKPRQGHSLAQVVAFISKVVDQVSPDQPVVLLLHDWGCLFGYEFAMRHPSRVSHLIGVDIGDAGSREHLASLDIRARLMIAAYQLWLVMAWRIGGRAGDWMTRRGAALLRARSDPAAIWSGMNYPYDIQWTGSFGSFRHRLKLVPACPMLFVFGKRKPFQFHSRHWADSLAARPGNRVVGLDTGHWVMREAPERFNAEVRDWLSAQARG